MRLKQIKLAGFKSFVDLTKVAFPHQMTAIVGPNGCGKSNIIDAVRWVLGESSAKNLRGDAMTDVIFNGAKNRNAIGQASVELIFDNSQVKTSSDNDNTATIPQSTSAAILADRTEIAVRRQVNRDGQNHYFLNGSKCRRRDITDIFLGTGLGPRSYAIIEQGTISRLIESKPQELRVFIEEAAGISQYKERRRETELKIEHTNENLSRLNDIRFEVEQQIEKLHIQAEAAKRFRELKQKERSFKAEILAMQWQNFQKQHDELSGAIAKEESEIKTLGAQLLINDEELLKNKQSHVIVRQDIAQCQAEQLELNKQTVVAEQSLKYAQTQTERSLAEKEKLNAQLTKLMTEQEASALTAADLTGKIDLQSQQFNQLEQKLNQDKKSLNDFQTEYADVQQQWMAASQQQAQNRQNIQHATQSKARLTEEKQRLDEQNARLIGQLTQLEQTLQTTNSSEQLNALDEQIVQAESDVITTENQLTGEQSSLDSLMKTLMNQQSRLQFINDSIAGLEEQLNEKPNWQQQVKDALGNDNTNTKIKAFFEYLNVDEQWLPALTTLLSNQLSAPVIKFTTDNHNQFSLIESFSLIEQNTLTHDKVDGTIAQYIDSKVGVLPWLNFVKVALDEQSPQELLSDCLAHESVICADGTWFGHGFVIKGAGTEQESVLNKQNKLTQLSDEKNTLETSIATNEQEQLVALTHFEQLTEIKHQQSKQLTALKAKQMTLIAGAKAQEQQHVWQQKQQQQLTHEQNTLIERCRVIETELEELNKNADNMQQLSNDDDEYQQLNQKQQSLQLKVNQHQISIEADQAKHHHLALSIEQLRMQHMQISQSQQHSKASIDAVHQQLSLIDVELIEKIDVEQLSAQVHEKQQLSSDLAARLSELQLKLASLLAIEESLNGQITQTKTQLELKKGKVTQGQINLQNYQVRVETLVEQIEAQQHNVEYLLEKLPAYATEQSWQRQLNQVTKSLSGLGAINLAAIDEYEQHISRKNHLDLQYEDLIQAISTLESAIAKIDQESRHKFKLTFDKVNQDLQTLFPKVFGGGSAYLELTSTDILESGVSIMARPPGKKNSTIHLLSGGEKALTALSLVFAIFRLNPAPFCMLDEVDAPLDDANVGRFCNLVREMSQTVQFIYISHNKIAMEMASHLTGVTMFEPGVSRMVSVDIDEAVAMAEVS